MDAILGYALSFSDTISSIVAWGVDHPAAGLFYGTLIADLVSKFFPQGGFGHGFIGVIMRSAVEAGKKAYGRKQPGS